MGVAAISTDSDSIRRALAHGDIERGLRDARLALANAPDDPHVLHWLGMAHLLDGNTSSALPALQRAVVLLPDRSQFWSNLSEALRRDCDRESALSAAERAIELDGNYIDAHINRAAALFQLERFDDALAEYDRALRDRPHDALLIAYRADCLRERGDYRAARRVYQKALQRDVDLAHAHANLGPLLMLFGETQAALAHCERAVALDAGSADAWMNLGHCLIELEQLDEAMQAYAQAHERDPNSSALCCAIGHVWQEVGDHEQAARWYERAHLREPDNLRVRTCIAGLLCDSGQCEQAALLYEELANDAPDDLRVLLGQARAAWENGDANAALKIYRHAAQLRPQMAQIHCHIADVWMSIGDFENAEVSQRTALAINPNCVSAVAGLATALRGKLPSSDAKRAERLLTHAWLRDGARSALHAGLAHHYDGIGRYTRAAHHASEGNRLYWNHRSRRGWRYDPIEHAAHVDRIIETFTPELFALFDNTGNADARPVFIVGMPRSGTTLTERMLAAHPSILGIGERPFAARSLQQLTSSQSTNQTPLAALAQTDRAQLTRCANDYSQILSDVVHKISGAPESVLRIVDKMPDNYELLGWIALLFPRAHLIHVRRDPRDIALSCWMQRFGQIRWACDMQHIAERLTQHRRLMEHWRRVLPVPLFEFDYETLVADFERTSRRIVEFVDLPWDAACLDYAEKESIVRTASVTQVRKPVYASSVARWKHYSDVLFPVLERFPDDRIESTRVNSNER
jgi:Flp pilus assembly protein TadD